MSLADFDFHGTVSTARAAECLAALSAWLSIRDVLCPASDALILAADELLTNIVTHGSSDALPHVFSMTASYGNGTVVLVLRDDGAPFDPTREAAPDIATPLARRAPGGLGLWLVRHVADTLSYCREGRFNVFTLCKRCPSPAAQERH